MTLTASTYVDNFTRDNLPDPADWPDFLLDRPEFQFEETLNTAVELLDKQVAAGLGSRPAIYSSAETLTYRDVLERANRMASVLVDDMGLVPGNRVLLRGPNSPWMATAWFAVLKAGGVAVPTMSMLRAKELAVVIDKAEVSHSLVDIEFLDEVELAKTASPQLIHTGTWGEAGNLNGLMAEKSGEFSNHISGRDDVAHLAFTSGTTGTPKATMHFHRDMMIMADTFTGQILKPTADDIFIGTPPLAFTFGLGGLLVFPLRFGASTVLDSVTSPQAMVEAIERYRATITFTAPTAYRAMLAELDGHDVSSLKEGVSAGETLPHAISDAWFDATGVRLIDGIGSTEMLHIFISAGGENIRPGATGKPVPGYEARVVDDAGEPVPAGTVGHLAVRGPTGCRYLNDRRQKDYVKNGWNLTGDAYLVDEDGYFWYQARTDDMIISGGYNIAGPEVEAALATHEAVEECAVVGAPDPDRGQIVTAFVVLAEGITPDQALVDALKTFVKSTIAPYKYPRRIEFIEELPKTETGKIQRYKLKSLEAGE